MAASHGASCSAECCLYRRIGALGSRRSHRCLAISGGPRWSFVDTVPRHRLRRRVHPLVSLALLLSSSCLRRPEHPSRACARPTTTGAFLGVHHLFATSAPRVHIRQASQAHLRSVLSVSHAPDGLLLAVPCRLVSSCCHVQVSRSRGFLPRTSRTTSSVAVTSAPLAPSTCHRLPDDASRRRVDLEVFIRSEIRSTGGGFSPA
jgi:hypothetical protein